MFGYYSTQSNYNFGLNEMKKIITAEYIYTPKGVLKNHALLIDEKIVTIAPKSRVLRDNKDVEVIAYPKNSLLFPGLINAHVHIEFSANKTELSYGDFINWLYSVIENREDLMHSCDLVCMSKAIDEMLKNGITTFGAISSHGLDFEACVNAKQNVVYFNELIGSQAAAADVLFGDFLDRLNRSKERRSKRFIPAVAIHSPYSVHPILIKKGLEVVKKENLPLTAHFMESGAEREWLDDAKGDFSRFFEKFLNQKTPVSSAQEFLTSFEDVPTLFAHAVKATKAEYEQLKHGNHSIAHCPISNRLLGNGALDLKTIEELGVNWCIATDGLSSNYGLDLWEEMRVALFMHTDLPLHTVAKKLILAATKNAAVALRLPKGEIKEGFDADLLVLQLDDEPTSELELHLILHRYEIIDRYILGERV